MELIVLGEAALIDEKIAPGPADEAGALDGSVLFKTWYITERLGLG